MDIYTWLSEFEYYWKTRDVDSVLSLFKKDVEYWETPHNKINSFNELKKEWKVIKYQQNIDLWTRVFSSEGNKHSVKWELTYEKVNGPLIWAGVYLIELDEKGLCTYFLQVGENNGD